MSEAMLICPKTQKACLYVAYCGVRKESMEREKRINPGVRELLISLPSPKGFPAALVEADTSSFCSEERVDAILDATIDMEQPCGRPSIEYGDVVLGFSARMRAEILQARERRLPKAGPPEL